MKASRAAIKTAKAVVSVEERLTAIEVRLIKIERVLQRLIKSVSADKPSIAAEALGKSGAPKVRTVRKRGGGA